MVYDSIYVKFKNRQNLCGNRNCYNSYLQGIGRKYKGISGGDENVLYLNLGAGYTDVYVFQNSLNCTLKL